MNLIRSLPVQKVTRISASQIGERNTNRKHMVINSEINTSNAYWL